MIMIIMMIMIMIIMMIIKKDNDVDINEENGDKRC